jgi:hypothetical protein
MALYQDQNAKFSNTQLNSVGSEYANTYGHNVSTLVAKLTNRRIFNSAPQQFMDLRLLNEVPLENVTSDEFFYQEMGYQREALVVTGSAAAVTYPGVQVVPVQSVDFITTNTIVVYQNGQQGVVTTVDPANLEIHVTPHDGDSVPAVSAADVIANISSVDRDGSDGFAQHFRATTIERNNYIQLFNMAMRYGEVELFKLKNQGTTSNFLEMEREAMFQQHRINLSNAFWIGRKGQVTLRDGSKAKTTGGVFTRMQEAGSPNGVATPSTLKDVFESVVFASEYGSYGARRMAFLAPRLHRILSNAYKEELTRYAPNDEVAMLNLKEVNLGSSIIVFVPFKRFEDAASFPAAFKNRIVILDMKNLTRCQLWGERSGETPSLGTDGTPKRYKDVYVDSNMGVKDHNPLAHAWVDVTGI